jgi:hypothetical protein
MKFFLMQDSWLAFHSKHQGKTQVNLKH